MSILRGLLDRKKSDLIKSTYIDNLYYKQKKKCSKENDKLKKKLPIEYTYEMIGMFDASLAKLNNSVLTQDAHVKSRQAKRVSDLNKELQSLKSQLESGIARITEMASHATSVFCKKAETYAYWAHYTELEFDDYIFELQYDELTKIIETINKKTKAYEELTVDTKKESSTGERTQQA